MLNYISHWRRIEMHKSDAEHRLNTDPSTLSVQNMYSTVLRKLQADILMWICIVGGCVALIFSIQSFYSGFILHTIPISIFFIHTLRNIVMIPLTLFLLFHERILLAWIIMLTMSLSTLMLQIWILQNPGIFIFALFSMAGAAIAFSIRINSILICIIVCLLYTIVRYTFFIYSNDWLTVVLIFLGIMSGFMLIGAIVRRFMRKFARMAVELEQQAKHRGKIEQQREDLTHHVAQLTALEHDLRQPLRAVQGYLIALNTETDAADLIQPALAAAQRADRLTNNLLDLARTEAHRPTPPPQLVALSDFFTRLRQTAPGIARYYTDPPVPIHFYTDALPAVRLYAEQFERALLNLLDNALIASPPNGEIIISAQTNLSFVCIKIRDQGRGISQQVIEDLFADRALSSQHHRPALGLRQVYATVQAHYGKLQIQSSACGTCVAIDLPIDRLGSTAV